MDRKLFFVLVLAALGAIAYAVKTKRIGRGSVRDTSGPATADAPPPPRAAPSPTVDRRKERCESSCSDAWSKRANECMNSASDTCVADVNGARDRCMASCR